MCSWQAGKVASDFLAVIFWLWSFWTYTNRFFKLPVEIHKRYRHQPASACSLVPGYMHAP